MIELSVANGLRFAGTVIYDWLTLPWSWMHSAAQWLAPSLAQTMIEVTVDDWRLPIALSLLSWMLLGCALHRIVAYIRQWLQFVARGAADRTFRWRLKWRMQLAVWRERWPHLFPDTAIVADMAEVQLDEQSIEVMQYAARLGPGRPLSAAEMASDLELTPSQAQRRIYQLCKLQLLQGAAGRERNGTFYTLSTPGEMYVSLWQQSSEKAA